MPSPFRTLCFITFFVCIVLQAVVITTNLGRIVQFSSLVGWQHGFGLERFVRFEQPQIMTLDAYSGDVNEVNSLSYSGDDFVYKERKWGNDCPEVKYKVNVNTDQVNQGDGTEEDFRQAIINAARTWNAVDGATYVLTYDGETDATTTGYNGTNEVIFAPQGLSNPSALARIWFTTDFIILEADIWINSDYQWDTTGNPTGEEIDLQSVLLHEFGHWLALGHDSSPQAVMFSTVTMGTVKRELHQHEIKGISYIYPRGVSSTCPTGNFPVITATPEPIPTFTNTPQPVSTPAPAETSTNAPTEVPTLEPTSTAGMPTSEPSAVATTTATRGNTSTATMTSPPTMTPSATPSASPNPGDAGDIQVNYDRGAPGSFFTFRGVGYSANQDLTLVVVNIHGMVVQEQPITINSDGEFSLMIHSAGAPAGRYALKSKSRDVIGSTLKGQTGGMADSLLTILLDSSEPLRAQEPPLRSESDGSLFEFPLIDFSRLLYLPFTS